jgi:hypothetical protein
MEYFEPENNMNHLLARRQSSSSLCGKQSEAGSAAPSSITLSDHTKSTDAVPSDSLFGDDVFDEGSSVSKN